MFLVQLKNVIINTMTLKEGRATAAKYGWQKVYMYYVNNCGMEPEEALIHLDILQAFPKWFNRQVRFLSREQGMCLITDY